MSLLDDAQAILDQLSAAGAAPLPVEVLAALEASRAQLAAMEARIAPTMAEIGAALNPAPPEKRVEPLRVKERKRAKTA